MNVRGADIPLAALGPAPLRTEGRPWIICGNAVWRLGTLAPRSVAHGPRKHRDPGRNPRTEAQRPGSAIGLDKYEQRAGTRGGARRPLLVDRRASLPAGSSRPLGTDEDHLSWPLPADARLAMAQRERRGAPAGVFVSVRAAARRRRRSLALGACGRWR